MASSQVSSPSEHHKNSNHNQHCPPTSVSGSADRTMHTSADSTIKRCAESTTKRIVIYVHRHRRQINVVLYVILLSALGLVLINPAVLEPILPFMTSPLDTVPVNELLPSPTTAALTTRGGPTIQRVYQFPFVPRDFQCDEMHESAARNFTYPDGYEDHADAYKSALALNNLMSEGTTNEQAWLLIDIAQLPPVKTVCETGFFAGNHAFYFLTANFDVVVHSFENLQRFNFTLEMSDFMIIEFPDRFYIYDGEPAQSIPKFISGENGNKTICDVIFVDSSQELDTIRTYFKQFRRIANRVENIVIMDAHPRNVIKSRRGAETVWEEMKKEKVIQEHFRCYFRQRDLSANQMGLLVGSYVFEHQSQTKT